MLQRKLSLPGLDDVETFCAKVIERNGISDFGYLERDDLLQELITYVWQLSLVYDPDRGVPFRKFITHALSRFIVDWKRRQYRTKWTFRDKVYERPRPVITPYDDRPDGTDHSFLDRTDTGGLSDVLGLQRARGGKGVRHDQEAGGAATSRAA